MFDPLSVKPSKWSMPREFWTSARRDAFQSCRYPLQFPSSSSSSSSPWWWWWWLLLLLLLSSLLSLLVGCRWWFDCEKVGWPWKSGTPPLICVVLVTGNFLFSHTCLQNPSGAIWILMDWRLWKLYFASGSRCTKRATTGTFKVFVVLASMQVYPLTWYPVKNEDCGAGKLGVDVKCRFCTRGWLGQDG